MQTLQAVITGSIQGLSEFLPISSSAHIVFSNSLYNLFVNNAEINKFEEIFFDICVHFGTLLAVLLYFYNDLKHILKEFIKSLKEKKYSSNETKLLFYIFLSTIITGVIGIILKYPVEMLVSNPKFVCILLFITGLILLLSEKAYRGDKDINIKSVILISIAQGLAIFPGFSRSGFTIATALFCGMERVKAARFSFLMSIPVIFLASFVYPLMELDFSKILQFNITAIITGTIVSFVVGYFCIKYFMKLLGRLSLKIFGYYCFLASVLMFLLFQFVYHH